MKSYTDLKQSKKLAEILPLESADMYYACGAIAPDIMIGSKQDYRCYTMCWSLAALLSVLPGGYVLVKNYHGLYYVESRGHEKSTNIFNNPVDACYEMIIKLHEQNLL